MVTERPLPGGGTTTLSGGTAISGGGTPDKGGGSSPFRLNLTTGFGNTEYTTISSNLSNLTRSKLDPRNESSKWYMQCCFETLTLAGRYPLADVTLGITQPQIIGLPYTLLTVLTMTFSIVVEIQRFNCRQS